VADFQDKRRKLQIGVAALGLVDVALLAVLFSPLVGSQRSRNDELDQLWRDLQVKTRQVEPLMNVDKKIVTARKQIDDFYRDRLPARDSAISEELGKIAKQNGVSAGQIRYKWKDAEPVGLRPVEIDGEFSGDYLHLVRFINAVERNPVFFLIDSVQLGGEEGGKVKLQMHMETYLRSEA
jgi:type IV pilus assembly protein PilO